MSLELKRSFLEDELDLFSEEADLTDDLAFMHWFYRRHFDLDDEDEIPPDEIVDGSGERQIDLFRIDIDDIEQRSHIWLIQTKTSKSFGANTVSLMKAGLDFIFKTKRKKVLELKNQKFVQKILEARDVIKQYGNTNISVSCLYVTLGDDQNLPEEALENASNIMDEYESGGVFGDFEFKFCGVHELDRILNIRRNRARKINFDLPIAYDANRPSIIEFESAGVGSLLCTVRGEDLAKLALVEPRDAVFDANVRGNLGLGGRVNKNIYASSIENEQAKYFWFMNNGITMVCDAFSIVRDPDSPMVKLTNLQIINGCQTTSSIRAAYEAGELSEDVKLQLKIYQSKDRSFVDNVVVATNNQNAIGTRDLHANDEIQLLIQRRIEEDYDLFYERKRGEAKSANVPKSKVINMEKAGQAYLAVFKRQPTISRAQKYKVYAPEYYSEIFEKGRPSQIAVSHELYKYSETLGRKAYRELEDDDPLRNILNYGVFHITRIMWWVLEKETDIDTADHASLITKIRSGTKRIEKVHERATDILFDIVDENNESFVNLNNYFKKTASQQDINKHLVKLEKDD
ncbi:AIPR family protein [Henriciella sp. AS95]|uniref:AIPR family protein n=1 Tax=Henriciella sp. AS95 TaxID=3135782 RepID=UPI00317911C0